jgi:hypothetical protein
MNTEGLQEYLLFTVVLGVPYFRILRRAGLSPYYAALVVVPFLGYLAIEVVLAFARWPRTQPTVERMGTN